MGRVTFDGADPAFTVAEVRSVCVRAPGPDYWQGFLKRDASTRETRRFQFSPPWRTVYAREVESALVRVRLADGTVGWGEATCPVAPEVICTLINGFFAELVEGQAFASVATLVDFVYDAQRCRGYHAGHYQDAAAALDIALHDALAKRAGCPVSALFAAAPATTLPCYLSGARAPSREERITVVQQWLASGSRAVKLFLRGDLAADLDEFAALRSAVPQIDWWAVDALWTYGAPALATEAKRAFGALGVAWLECPMLPEDLSGHTALRAHHGAPVALGEHFRTDIQVAPWLEARAVDILQPDIGRTGFVMGGRMLAHASACGIAATPHMGGALDIMQAATLHFAAAGAARLPCEYQQGLAHRLPAAIRSHWKVGPQGFEMPAVPGLGIEVDEDALQKFIV